MVAPVQVLDGEKQRLRRRCDIEQGAELAQHALLPGARELASQQRLVGLLNQPGELGQPSRRGLAQGRLPARARRAASQYVERIEDR